MEKADKFTHEDMQTETTGETSAEGRVVDVGERSLAGGGAAKRMFYEALNIYFSCVSFCRVY